MKRTDKIICIIPTQSIAFFCRVQLVSVGRSIHTRMRIQTVVLLFQYGNTAAHEAAWKGYSATVCVLARGGADLRLLNGAGFTPLHFACQNGHNQSCREILLAGAPPDLQNTVNISSKSFLLF